LPNLYMLEHLANLTGGTDRDRQRAVKRGRIPVHLAERKDIPRDVADRRIVRVGTEQHLLSARTSRAMSLIGVSFE